MSMWRQIRLMKGLTLEELSQKTKKPKQMLSRCENGHVHMPVDLQIAYLKLRNNEEDKIIVKYLEEML